MAGQRQSYSTTKNILKKANHGLQRYPINTSQDVPSVVMNNKDNEGALHEISKNITKI
jgi:hypothetical protein